MIPAPAQALLGSDAVAHVWTRNADGSPQVSVVWVLAQGDEIVFGCAADSRKARNLRRDPQVVVSIEDTERNERGFQRHLVIRGTATVVPCDADVLVRLSQMYHGLDEHPLLRPDAPDCAMVRIAADRISGVGPWVEPSPASAAAAH